MNKINTNNIIVQYYPDFSKKAEWKKKVYLWIMSRLLHVNEINTILEKYGEYEGIDFIDNLFEHLNFSFNISNKDIKKIPSEGKLICVANHPIGSLDGLAFLKMISEIREDVKIIANDILFEIENLRSHFLPFNLETKKNTKTEY